MHYWSLQKEKEKQNGGIKKMEAKTIIAVVLVVFIVASLVFLRFRNKKNKILGAVLPPFLHN